MAYIIIFFAIAAVLGPLIAVLPSKRQRRLADFRERARKAGVHVSLNPLKGIPPRLQRATDDPLVGYGIRLMTRQVSLVEHDLFVRSRSGWESKSGKSTPSELQDLPASAEIVVVDENEIAVYWSELGGEEALEKVLLLLGLWHPKGLNESRLS